MTLTRLCPRCGSPQHGRPSVRVADGPSPAISLAYADGLVAAAWSWSGPVGIDVEPDGPELDGIDRREWTRREALFKAGGDRGLPVVPLEPLPPGYVGTLVGRAAGWRVAGTADEAAASRYLPKPAVSPLTSWRRPTA